MNRDFIGALLQLNAEKNIPREQLVRTVAEAIQSAYRRVTPGNENVWVEVDPETGRIRAFRAMHVVPEVEDPTIEFLIDEAQQHDPKAKLGDLVETEQLDASSFGRIHAQTAKQLVLQRLREVEREQVFGQYAQRETEIITGTVSRVEPRGVILDVGRAEAILATTDQSAMEHYRIGQHVKAYVLEVRRTTKGPLIYVSRTHKNFLRRLFELEVPEIHAGAVEIKAIAREAGSRSKVAVSSRQEGLDPVGATVGQRGGRVQAVVAELGGEKIDVIPWHEDPAVFVANALSPAQVVSVNIDEQARIASVTVPERMLSLAIGREGQNARLAAKLTGWRIDIRSDQPQPRPADAAPPAQPAAIAEVAAAAGPGPADGVPAANSEAADGVPAGPSASEPAAAEAVAEPAVARRARPAARRGSAVAAEPAATESAATETAAESAVVPRTTARPKAPAKGTRATAEDSPMTAASPMAGDIAGAPTSAEATAKPAKAAPKRVEVAAKPAKATPEPVKAAPKPAKAAPKPAKAVPKSTKVSAGRSAKEPVAAGRTTRGAKSAVAEGEGASS